MKQNRKTNSLLMLGIILAVLAVAGMAMVGAGAAVEGSGTEDDPYLLNTVDDLRHFLNSDEGFAGIYGKLDNSTGVFGLDETIRCNETKTLDLNGQVIKLNEKKTGSVISITPDYNSFLTIKDTNQGKQHYFDATSEPWKYMGDERKGEGCNTWITVKGGVITGGNETAGYGGGISLVGGNLSGLQAKLDLKGGNIVGNTAQYGGGVSAKFTYSPAGCDVAHIIMSDGCIIGNKATGNGGGVYLYSYNGGSPYVPDIHACTLTMSGGSITKNYAASDSGIGGVGGEFVKDGMITLSGSAKIIANINGATTKATSNLKVTGTNDKINLSSALGNGARIGVTSTTGNTITTNYQTDAEKYFVSDVDDVGVTANGTSNLVMASGHIHDGITFATAVSTKDGLEKVIKRGGSAYLTENIEGNFVIDKKEVNLCLNGHTIKAADDTKPVFYVDAENTLTIYDCREDEAHRHYFYTGESKPENPPTERTAGKWTLYDSGEGTTSACYVDGGVITGGGVTGSDNYLGAGVDVNWGIFNFYGGNIVGNNAAEHGGGGVGVSDTEGNKFTMNGGTICGNFGKQAGGVYIQNGFPEFTMNGGKIVFNRSDIDGGIWAVDATMKITAGVIENNIGEDSGGVCAQGLELSGEVDILDNKDGEDNVSDLYLGKTDTSEVKNLFTIGDGGLSEKSLIGVVFEGTYPSGTDTLDISNKYSGLSGQDSRFFSDMEGYVVGETADEDDKKLVLKEAKYTVTYDGNGQTSGSAPTDTKGPYKKNDEVTVLGKETLEKTGYIFGGWKLDDTVYQEGEKFPMPGKNVTLKVNWAVCEVLDTDGKVIGYYDNVGDAVTAVNKATENVTLKLLADVEGNIEINNTNGKTITLDLNGYILQGTGTIETPSAVITTSSDLVINDSGSSKERYFKVTLDGEKHYLTFELQKDIPATSVKLEDFDPLELLESSKKGEDYYVKVLGGIITGGYADNGGGVNVGTGVNLTLNGGNILGNDASNGGGVNVQSGGSICINGGNIVGNHANYGGGVYLKDSTFKLVNGNINGNVVTPSSGTSGGGGVYCDISGADKSVEFEMNGGCIARNVVNYNSKGSQDSGSGGGIILMGYGSGNASFKMMDGKICDNCVNSTGTGYSYGGGVQINADYCNFVMSGGSISGNHAKDSGGLLCSGNSGTSIIFGGNAKIYDNTDKDKNPSNVILDGGRVLSIGDGTNIAKLEEGADIRVSLFIWDEEKREYVPSYGNVTSNYPDGAPADGWEKYFTSDVAGLTPAKSGHHVVLHKGTEAGTCKVSYNKQEGEGGEVPGEQPLYELGKNVIVLGNPGNLTKENHKFVGWQKDGSGEVYLEGDEIPVKDTNEIKLYAAWVDDVAGTDPIVAINKKNGKGYTTVQEAIYDEETVEEGDIIVMVGNTNEDITIGYNLTLDLNGYVLKGTGAGPVVMLEGQATLVDSDINASSHKKHYFKVLINPEEEKPEYSTELQAGLWVLDDDLKDSKCVIEGGVITGGIANEYPGGGVCIKDESTFTMTGGTIVGNKSVEQQPSAGGVGVKTQTAIFVMDGGSVIGNYSTSGTGGIYLEDGCVFNMCNGIIEYNLGKECGGVCVHSLVDNTTKFNMSGGRIANNVADTVLMGGVGGVKMVGDLTPSVVRLGGAVQIAGNTNGNLINNDDTHVLSKVYIGGDGIPNLRDGALIGVAPSTFGGNLVVTENYPDDAPEGGWKKYFRSDKEGYKVIANDTTNPTKVVLEESGSVYTVTYNGNGATGGIIPVDYSTEYTPVGTKPVAVNPGTMKKSGSTFVCWNTEADGSGTNYNPGDSITLEEGNFNTMLYAKWIDGVFDKDTWEISVESDGTILMKLKKDLDNEEGNTPGPVMIPANSGKVKIDLQKFHIYGKNGDDTTNEGQPGIIIETSSSGVGSQVEIVNGDETEDFDIKGGNGFDGSGAAGGDGIMMSGTTGGNDTLKVNGVKVTGGKGGSGAVTPAAKAGGNGGSGISGGFNAVTADNSSKVNGGDGGDGCDSTETSDASAGGDGGAGIAGDSTKKTGTVTVNDGSEVKGGNGGDGGKASGTDGKGGDGGNGGAATDNFSSSTVSGKLTGGNGGNGGDSATGKDAGEGGDGGAGTGSNGSNATFSSGSETTGGNGGNGGSSSGGGNAGKGGDGGTGSASGGTTTVAGAAAPKEKAKITGGNGGNGGNSTSTTGGTGGDGGAGGKGADNFDSSDISGILTGGNGGNGGSSSGSADAGKGGDGGAGTGSSGGTNANLNSGSSTTGGNGGVGGESKSTGKAGTGGKGGNGTDNASTTCTDVDKLKGGDGGNGGKATDSGTQGDGGKGGESGVTGKGESGKTGKTAHKVTVSAGEHGTGGSADPGVAYEGEEVTLTQPTVAEGYKFSNWTSSEVTVSGNKFTMPDAAVTVTAEYEEIGPKTCKVTFTAGEGGAIKPSSPITVDKGTSFSSSGNVMTVGTTKVTANPNGGYEFDSWNPASGTVETYTTITANFTKLIEYTVSIPGGQYSYGSAPYEPTIDPEPEKALVVYYYSKLNTGSGTVWSKDAADKLDARADPYYVYATVNGVETPRSAFKVVKAEQDAPSSSFTIDTSTLPIKVTIASEDVGKSLEYYIEGKTMEWVTIPNSSRTFTISGLDQNKEYTLKLRVQESDNKEPSDAVSQTFTTPDLTPVYTLTYNANGGSGTPEKVSEKKGTTVWIDSGLTVTKPGYEFDGWWTDSAGGTQISGSIELESDMTLYAHWTATNYTVVFNANGGSGTMNDQVMPTGYSEELKANSFTGPSGATFAGWSLTSTGPVAYLDKQSVSNIAGSNGEITLYAVWLEQDTYAVGGTVSGKDGVKVTLELKYGNSTIATTECTITGETGRYSFGENHKVPNGIYNIVATTNGGETVNTALVEVKDGVDVPEIRISEVNSKVIVEEENHTPAVVAGGLEEEAETHAEEGKKVTVTLTVESKVKADVAGTGEEAEKEKKAQKAIEKLEESSYVSGDKVDYIDMNVTKKVNDEKPQAISKTNEILEIVIPYDFTGKKFSGVVRYHGDEVEPLTPIYRQLSNNEMEDGTYFADEDNSRVYVYTDSFSVYAFCYDDDTPEPTPSHGGSSTSSFSGTSTVTDGVVHFDRSTVVTDAYVPGATKAKITKVSGSDWYNFKLEASGFTGDGGFEFQVPLDVIQTKGYTTGDVTALQGETILPTKLVETNNQYAIYTAEITGDGTYGIGFRVGATGKETETPVSTDTDTKKTLNNKSSVTFGSGSTYVTGVNFDAKTNGTVGVTYDTDAIYGGNVFTTKTALSEKGDGTMVAKTMGIKQAPVLIFSKEGGEEVQFHATFNINTDVDSSTVKEITFKVPLSELNADGFTYRDVILYHGNETTGEWIPLDTYLVKTDSQYAYYKAETDGASPFGIMFMKEKTIVEESSSSTKTEEETKPTSTTKSPFPVLGILAGLGAAALFLRRKN